MLEPLTGFSWLSSWKFDPLVLVLAMSGIGYLLAVRRLRQRGEAWPSSRVLSFFIGLSSAALVTTSALGVYANTLFWTRAVQTVVLLLVSPLWLALGAPVTLVLKSVSSTLSAWLRRWGRSQAARAVTFPLMATLLLVIPPFMVYLTPLYQLCLRHPLADHLVHLILLGCGFVYFWTRLRVDPAPRDDSYLVSLWISLTEVVFDGVLGLVVWFGPLIAADYYQAVGRTWGPDLRLDQIIGAGVLWIGGDLAGLPFIGALFVRWARDDQRKAKEIDRELDNLSVSSPVGGLPASSSSNLWWEADPVLSERFKSR